MVVTCTAYYRAFFLSDGEIACKSDGAIWSDKFLFTGFRKNNNLGGIFAA